MTIGLENSEVDPNTLYLDTDPGTYLPRVGSRIRAFFAHNIYNFLQFMRWKHFFFKAHEESSEIRWWIFVRRSSLFSLFSIVWIRIWNTFPFWIRIHNTAWKYIFAATYSVFLAAASSSSAWISRWTASISSRMSWTASASSELWDPDSAASWLQEVHILLGKFVSLHHISNANWLQFF